LGINLEPLTSGWCFGIDFGNTVDEDELASADAGFFSCFTPREVSDWYLEARLSSGGKCNGSICNFRRSLFNPNRQAADRCGAIAAIYGSKQNIQK
jgi:hypothetical protein